MTAIEHRELRGITIKNLAVTLMGTASIVASVMTTYFGLRDEIRDIGATQKTEERIYNIRIKMLEDQMVLLQREVDEIKFGKASRFNGKTSRSAYPAMLISVKTPVGH